jgi:uncharacterized protein (TIGR02453 family)
MIQATTLKFLKTLAKNNNKAWMDAHRNDYLAAKEDFEKFVTAIIENLSKKDPDIKGLTAKDCTFRLNRDVRFSKDKSPYKSNFGAYFSRGGKKSIWAGYYFNLDPAESFVCGGIWMPEPDSLKKLRQEIDYNFAEFSKIMKQKKMLAQFNGFERSDASVLSRPPKGYDESNPAIEYIKRKSFVALKPLPAALLTSKDLLKETISAFETVQPLVAFFNRGLE